MSAEYREIVNTSVRNYNEKDKQLCIILEFIIHKHTHTGIGIITLLQYLYMFMYMYVNIQVILFRNKTKMKKKRDIHSLHHYLISDNTVFETLLTP